MANISYEILYTPVLPITQQPFEYLDGNGKFKIYFNISVGNTPEDFSSGFIRIKNAQSENNVLTSDYLEQVIPFSNKQYSSKKDLMKTLKVNIPIVNKDENGLYIEIPKKVFGEDLLNSKTDIKDYILNQNLYVQLALTKDIVSSGSYYKENDSVSLSTTGDGAGDLLLYNEEKLKWEHLEFSEYFNGDILAKGISSWSSVSTLNVLTETRYKLVASDSQKELMNISSPITEFIGVNIQKTPITNIGLQLKKYKIEIFNDELENKQLIDSSDWISGTTIDNLEIKWQNKIELVDKHHYLVRLTINNYFGLIKSFDFKLKTYFQKSEFNGELKVYNNHDLARNELELKIKSPLLWGPENNIEIKEDFGVINEDGISIEQGINLTPNKGSWSGEFIFSGIDPIKNWEENGDDFFLRIQTSEPTLKNPYQFAYYVYALSTPTSFDVNYGKKIEDYSPYVDDIIYNPIIPCDNNNSIKYKLFLDSSDDLYDNDDEDIEKNNRVLTLGLSKTNKEYNYKNLFIREYDKYSKTFLNKWWKLNLNENGKVSVIEASTGAGVDFSLKPVYLYDPIKNLITEMGVSFNDDGEPRLFFDNILRPFEPTRSKRPTYINEFRVVKKVFNLTSGLKNEIFSQTYRAFLNGPDQKLHNWKLIAPERKYYLHLNEKNGYIQLNVADITEDFCEKLDRYNAINNGSSIGLLNDQILTMRGLDGNSYMIQRKPDGTPLYYNLSVDSLGIPDVDFGSLSAITITYEPLLNKDLGIDNNLSSKNDDLLDFDEITADIVVNDETILENYQFKFCKNIYQSSLIELAKNIEKSKMSEYDKVFLFANGQEYQENYLPQQQDKNMFNHQYDAIDCMVELTHMTNINAVLLGGNNIAGESTLYDSQHSLTTLRNKLLNSNSNTGIISCIGGNDSNCPVLFDTTLGQNNTGILTQSGAENNLIQTQDFYSTMSFNNNVFLSTGCGYMIKDNILFLILNSTDTTLRITDGEITRSQNLFNGYSINQLNQVSKILKENGNKVNNIIIISNVPTLYNNDSDEKNIETLNLNILNQLLRDYNNGKINLYGNKTENSNEAQIIDSETIDRTKYSKITLGLHGFLDKDYCYHTNGFPQLITAKSSNIKNLNGKNVLRINDDTNNETNFKAIIYNEEKNQYKIINYGYSNKSTLTDIILKGDE